MQSPHISFKDINRLAVPAIFAGIVEPIISLTDTAVAGRLPLHADEALGAIGLVGSFLSAMIWIFSQTSNAISSMVAQAVGRDDIHTIKSLVIQVILFNLAVGLILSIVGYMLGDYIFQLYGAKGELLTICQRYFNIRVWGFPLTLLTFTLFGIFKGYQNTSWAMRVSFLGGITNILLDLYFVFYLDFSIEGIAYASLTAQFLMFLFAFYYFIKNTPFRFVEFHEIHPQFKETLFMSFDLFVRTLSLNIALFLAFRTATVLGEGDNNAYVGAHSILVQVWLFSAFFLDGYANAATALSGRLLGGKHFKQLWKLVIDLSKIMLVIGLVIGLMFYLLQEPIVNALTHSKDVIALFITSFWLVALMQPINAIAFLLDGTYKGLAETKAIRNVFILALVLGFIPVLYLSQYLGYGLQGIWFTFLIWMIFRSSGLIWHFNRKYKV